MRILRYAFNSPANNYENLKFSYKDVPMELLYGAFTEQGEMMAGAITLDYSITIRGVAFQMAGIAGVATKPEFRNQGAIRKIFHFLHQDLHTRQIPIAVLYPFKFSYYEQFGYKLVDEVMKYQIDLENIDMHKLREPRILKEVYAVTDEIKSVYKQFTTRYNYMCNRTAQQWGKHADPCFKFVCYTEHGVPTGYLFLHYYSSQDHIRGSVPPQEIVTTYDFVYLDEITLQALVQFLGVHRSQRKFAHILVPVSTPICEFMESPRGVQRYLKSNSMARIIDVEAVLKSFQYPVEEFSVSLQVLDSDCIWNNCTFQLQKSQGHIHISKIKSTTPDLRIRIEYFTQLLVGFKSIIELVDHGFAQVISLQRELLLNQLFPRQVNFLYDGF